MKSKILIVGGAGYIGSHMVLRLAQAGYDVVVFDNLSHGHRDAVLAGELVVGDLADRAMLARLFAAHRFDAVMHFASSIQVGESVQQPARYYANNVGNTIHLVEAMIEHGVQRLIFSSTAAIFGDPIRIPIDETHPRQPVNPMAGANPWWSRYWPIATARTVCALWHCAISTLRAHTPMAYWGSATTPRRT